MNRPRRFDLSDYREPLAELIWTLNAAKGEFRLLLVRCNYIRLRLKILKYLQTNTDLQLQIVKLKPKDTALHEGIRHHLQQSPQNPDAVMVMHLEFVQDLQCMLSAANQVREEFRKQFPYPVVLWVSDGVLQQLMRVASDLESWGTTMEFSGTVGELLSLLERDTDALFATALLSDKYSIGWQLGYLRRQEIDSAIVQLQQINYPISPALQASVDFAQAQTAYLHGQIHLALECFTRSWQFWRSHIRSNWTSNSPSDRADLRMAVLHFYLSLCHYQLADQDVNSPTELAKARLHIQACLRIFEQLQLDNLQAKYINLLCSILLRQEAWLELANLSLRAIDLQRLYGNPLRVAQAYGFLGAVELHYQRFNSAKEYLHKSLHSLAQLKTVSPLTARYLLQLAAAEHGLGNMQIALRYLEIAKHAGIGDNWRQYLKILRKLRSHYRASGQYVDAYRLKQEMYSIMTQNGIHAFVGINPIRPPLPPKLAIMQWLGINLKIEHTAKIAKEIIASERIRDVENLIERIIRPDYKLMVLYGDSGVGKTSLLEAGLVPALMGKTIGFEKAIAIMIHPHIDWQNLLVDNLLAAISQIYNFARGRPSIYPKQQQQEPQEKIFSLLQFCLENSLRLLLIVDNFEILLCHSASHKWSQELLQFIDESLQVLAIKVIISLRSDFLPDVIQNEYIESTPTLNGYLKNQDNYYRLCPFSPASAYQLVTALNQHRNPPMDTDLIKQMISDLTIEGQISPLQLQILATQLQSEGITTLARYQKYGEQTHLMVRYLHRTIAECGSKNRELSIQILGNLQITPQTRLEIESKIHASSSDPIDTSNFQHICTILELAGIITIDRHTHHQRYQLAYTYLDEIITKYLV